MVDNGFGFDIFSFGRTVKPIYYMLHYETTEYLIPYLFK